MRTKAVAVRDGVDAKTYLIAGHKHFGSGSGITSFMLTTAAPEGETEPDRWRILVIATACEVALPHHCGRCQPLMELAADVEGFG